MMKKLFTMMLAMLYGMTAWCAMPDGFTFYTNTNGISTAFTALPKAYDCAIGIAWNSTKRTTDTPTDLGAGIPTDYEGSFVIPSFLKDQAMNVTEIGYKAFYNCRGITNVEIPYSIKYIDVNAFNGCTSLAEVSIPGSVTIIDMYAFAYCYDLEKVKLHNGTQTIEAYAFLACKSLKSIDIPASVTTIGTEAFGGGKNGIIIEGIAYSKYGCDNLTSVIVHWDDPISIHYKTFCNAANAVLYVPEGTIDKYANAEGWKEFNKIVEIPKIAYAVYDNGTLTFKYGEFTPNGTTSWDVSNTPYNGFLPSSLTWEGGLKHVVFDTSFAEARPKSCSYWFDASKELESIEGLEYLNTSEVTSMSCMFEACPKLTSLDLSHFDTSNVTDMGTMFAGATGLTVLDLSCFNTAKVANMDYMFAGSEKGTQFYSGPMKLKKIYVGDGWSAGGGTKMFEYCTSLVGGNGTTYSADHTDYTYARIDAAGAPGYLTKKSDVTTTTWTVTSTDDIPAGTKYELDDITLTIGEAESNDFAVNKWGGPYDETFKNLICGNEENGNNEGGTFYLFTPKKNGDLTVVVRQNVGGQKKFYVEESGRVMDAFNGILPNTDDGVYIGTYKIPVFANLTYKIYCAGSKMGFYGFTFESRDDAEVTNITFADEKVKGLCVDNWDTDNDGELSFAEAAAVTDINGVFNDNKEITSFDELRFFTGLTSLSFGALNECFELKSVCIPSSIEEMDGGAFASCHKLEYIGVDASNPKFKSYGVNNAVIERAANRLVVGCPDAIIPDDITTIGKAAFWGHAGDWKDIPASVTKIDDGAFAYGGLNAVNISANVEYIGESAFRCNSLWEVVIPAKVTYIGKDAFNECGLGKVTVLNPTPIELSNAETFNNRADATLIVPAECRAAYLAADYWKDFGMITEGLVAEEDWAGHGEFVSYEGTDATCARTADGLAINNPKEQTDIWTPQTVICGGELTLKTDHYYKVRLTVKVPTNGTYAVCLGTWGSSQGYDVQATASDDFQELEVEFNEYPYNLTGAHVLFQSGHVKGTTVIQNVQVLDVTNGETLLVEKNWISPFWFADEGTGATCEIVADGVAITNPQVQSELWQPQTEVLQGAKLKENHSYKVFFDVKIPSDGDLQVNMGNGDFNQQYAVPVKASEDFQGIEVMFNDFPETLDNVRVLFQNGGISGTCIVRDVQIIDLGNIPAELKYKYNPDEETATVIKDPDRNYKGAVVIPSIVEHNDIIYTVTGIEGNAFSDCIKLTSVTIPSTVTQIDGSPFGNCTNLTQIKVNSANTVYDSRNNCNAIIEKATNTLIAGCETTVIPTSVTKIGSWSFWGRWGMKTITIPTSVKTIGEAAFAYCIGLENITLPSSVKTIEGWAFQNSGLKSITLPSSLNTLGIEAFRNCEELTSVTIPDNLEEIPDSCFKYCAKLESIDLKNVKKIGGGAFASTGITNLVLPASVKEVCNDAFSWCPIATVDLGQVEKIGDCAFIGTAIEELTVPATLTEMGTDLGIETFSWNGAMKKVTFEEGCTKVFDTMFHGNENLSEVFLPYTITEIQPRAFEFCKSLTSITIPQDVEKIGEQAFNQCDALTEVTVDNPVPPVLDGAEAFSNRANATLNVPKDSRAAYEAAEYWKEFGMIVNVLAEENWDGPYWFDDGGVSATCNMTSQGIAIYNPKVQEVLWAPQTIVIGDLKLKQNHSYKVIVNAKIPSAGQLQLNLFGWDSWNNNISVNASNDFQDLEFLYENYPLDTNNGGVLFQNGGIKGTSVVRSIQVLDVTNGEEVIAEKNWADPYWFGEEGVGATYEMTAEGLTITNPKLQEEPWTPQTQVLKNAKLQKNHTYKVIVNAKIPSDGDLQMQLGSWGNGEWWDQSIPVTASSDFQDFEFLYQDYPVNAEDGHVLFQNGHIAGTCVVRNVRILDMGDNPVGLVYNYNDEDHTAEVTNNDKGKYKGDVTIPATVNHNGEDYTVTKINEEAFNGSNITSITIPATMKTIEPHSFAGTNDLMKITVDPANTVFDSRDNCNGIIEKAANKLVVGCQTTVIPDGITIIGEGAFHSRHQMTSMTIPESVKKIENGAFAFCYSLEEVLLPANIESLGWWAFLATPIKSITLPATLTFIGDQAFDGCSQLTEVTALNPEPIEIDGSVFSNRANATLYLPAGAKKAYKAAPIWKEFKETVEAEHNSVYSYDLTAYLGVSTGMEINLENWDPFTAYQFDIVLPNGITLEKKADGKGIKYTKGKRCAGSRSISVTARDNNTYRVICISTKNEVITGNDGALLTVYLVANENMGKKTTQAKIENVIMTTPEEKQVNFDPTTVTITTKTLLLGDSNDDEFVNVTDLVATVNYILGRPSDKFNKTAADITKDHVIDIFDVNSGLGLIKNGTRAARMMTRAGEASNDKMFINDFSISAGMTKQMQIKLSNKAAYTGFQFDLVLPEGIKITSYSTTARIPEDMNVDYNETEGVYRFLGGLGETAITGTSGSIINITVKADENLKGRNLTGYLRDVKLSTSDGQGPEIEETPFKITDETSGDMNKNGKLDPADVKAIADLIMTGEYNAKADVNGDNKVDAADIVIVTNEIK